MRCLGIVEEKCNVNNIALFAVPSCVGEHNWRRLLVFAFRWPIFAIFAPTQASTPTMIR